MRRELDRHNLSAACPLSISEPYCTPDGLVAWDLVRETGQEPMRLRLIFLDWSAFAQRRLNVPVWISYLNALKLIPFGIRILRSFKWQRGLTVSFVPLVSFVVLTVCLGGAIAVAVALSMALLSIVAWWVPLPLGLFLFALLIRSVTLLRSVSWSLVAVTGFGFARRLGEGLPPDLASSVECWSDAIAAHIDRNEGECALVAHSFGSFLSPPVCDAIAHRSDNAAKLTTVNMGSLQPLALLSSENGWFSSLVNRTMATPAGPHIEVFSACDFMNFPFYAEQWSRHPNVHQWDVDFFARGELWALHPRRLRSYENHFRYLKAQDGYSDFDFFDLMFSPTIVNYWSA